MATATFNLYDIFRRKLFDGGAIDLDAVTVKAALVTSAYTPNQNTHDFWDDVSANEVSGTNYVAGGNTLATGTVTLDGSGNVKVDFNDPAVWSESATGFSNADRVIIYRDTGVGSTSELIGYSNSFGPAGNTTGDFTVTLNAAGLITSAR